MTKTRLGVFLVFFFFLFNLQVASCNEQTVATQVTNKETGKVTEKAKVNPQEMKKLKHTSCKVDADCGYLNVCENSKCKHKHFLPPDLNEILGVISIIFGSALSNAGGIGGGGLLIPILIILLHFNAHEAIPISKLMIFTGALTSFLMGMKNKHPYREASATDFNIALVLIPMVLFGTMVGVTLNKVTPPVVILFGLTFVLVINTYKTVIKAFKLYEGENKEKENNTLQGIGNLSIIDKSKQNSRGNNHSNDNEEDEEGGKFISYDFNKDKSNKSETTTTNDKDKDQISTYSSYSHTENVNSNTSSVTNNSMVDLDSNLANMDKHSNTIAIEEELKKEQESFPLSKLKYMFACYILLLVVTFLKGSEHFESIIGVKSCSVTYWSIYFLYFPVSVGITYYVSTLIMEEYRYRLSIGYPYHSTDIHWNSTITMIYPIYAAISGCMAGLLGIGGGLVLGPLLLELGIHPTISTHTSNFLVLFTSSSTSIQFIILGMMNFNYGFVCTIASTIGSYFGTIVIHNLVEKTGRTSILVFALGAVLGISTLLIPAHTFMNMLQDIRDGYSIFDFNSPC